MTEGYTPTKEHEIAHTSFGQLRMPEKIPFSNILGKSGFSCFFKNKTSVGSQKNLETHTHTPALLGEKTKNTWDGSFRAPHSSRFLGDVSRLRRPRPGSAAAACPHTPRRPAAEFPRCHRAMGPWGRVPGCTWVCLKIRGFGPPPRIVSFWCPCNKPTNQGYPKEVAGGGRECGNEPGDQKETTSWMVLIGVIPSFPTEHLQE